MSMQFQFYYEKLVNMPEFQKFKKENPKAYLCSGFFMMDREDQKGNQFNLDFYLPEEKKIISFKLCGKTEMVNVENIDSRVPEKLPLNFTFDLDKYEEMILKKMSEDMIKGQVKKIIFSLQRLEKVDYLIITAFLSNMGILKIHLDIEKNKFTLFEKKSFLDMIKVVKKGDKF